MCLAIPGKIKKVTKKTAIIAYPQEEREVLLDPHIPVQRDDYVLVQMGVIIKKLDENEAMSSLREWTA